TLLVTLVGDDAIREWSTDFECEDGWLHVRDYQGEQYLVDGVTQKWAKKDVFLGLGVDGKLVSHVVGEFEDRIFLVGSRRGGGVDWYLFRKQDVAREGAP